MKTDKKMLSIIASVATGMIFLIALVFGVIGIPVIILTGSNFGIVGHIGVVYLILSLIYGVFNWNSNHWYYNSPYALERWQIVLITILCVILAFTALSWLF